MKMGEARGSASMVATLMMMMVVVVLLLLQCEIGSAANYTVGDGAGWGFGVAGWNERTTFKVGDIFEFYYNPQFHNVVVVDEKGFENCEVERGTKMYKSGHDHIKIEAKSFFIDGIPGNCAMGVKLIINV